MYYYSSTQCVDSDGGWTLKPKEIVYIQQRFPNFFCWRRPLKTYQYSRRRNEAKFANFKIYQKIVFNSCSLFKMHKNVSVYSQNTEKRLMWAVSLLLYTQVEN